MNSLSKILIVLLLLNTSNIFSQNKELLWLDSPKKIKTKMYVFDKELQVTEKGYILPKYNLEIENNYHNTRKIFYKKKLILDSSKETKNSFFLELYNNEILVMVFKPIIDSSFHNPIYVNREKMLIVDYKNNPDKIYEVNMNEFKLTTSNRSFKRLKKYYKKNKLHDKIGLLSKIDFCNKKLSIINLESEKIIFNMIIRTNISYNSNVPNGKVKDYLRSANSPR